MNNQRKPQGVPMGRGPIRGAMIVEKPKNGKQTFKKLLKYIGSSKKVFIILLVLTFLVSILSLVGPSLQGDAMGSITITKDNPEVNWESLLLLLIAMVIVYTLQAAFTYFQSLFSAKLSQEMIVKLRNDLFGHISKLPISYVDTHQHGDIMSRMTNDVDKISTTISSSISSLFSGILTIVGVLAITLYLNWFLTLVSMASVVLTIIVVKYLSKAMRKYFKKQQDLLGILNGHSEETITGYKTVIAYSQEKEAMDKFNKISTDLKNVGIKSQILGGVMGPLMNIINNIGFLIVCGVGGYLAATSSTLGGWGIVGYTITISTLSKFILYSKKFSRPINEIANLWSQVQSSMAAAERVFEIMDLPLEVDEGTKHMTDIKGNIKFENIHFSYVEGEEVLKGFNLSVKPGQKIAIVGATGSGKTTVVNLLMRFYDPQEGEITIDGININDIPKQELRKNISIVLQDAVLFETTIKENIKYGNENASDDEVKNSAEMSNASYFIERLPQKYETYLSESGSNLSQGQRQLLTIARTILADPKILILDEATSSVDTRTEKNIQDAMVKLMKNRTSLIIAHRLSTIQDADIIIVVDDGKVVEKGNHKELLNQKGKYYNLYQTQFAGNQI
ncbi:MAG: ABC transporter ATP-binding protein [Bacilli bacterium]|nr:ABC transporter ATP-binding protein [Bacilli bacterium]CCY08269.1 aBC transporter related protein [Coprobacillus sp. CAG:698]